tara:strand:- start:1284 stop:1679 length:396 start_codon:yes stop_codon:yes gene_type:complete
VKKAEMAEEMERLRSQLEEYEVDDSPSPDPNGYYVPTAMHIARPPDYGLGDFDNLRYYCDFDKQGSWVEEWMDDKKARTLPVCKDCIASWEEEHEREWDTRPVKSKDIPKGLPSPSNTVVKPSGIFVSDYR